jgi:hypothetical protein
MTTTEYLQSKKEELCRRKPRKKDNLYALHGQVADLLREELRQDYATHQEQRQLAPPTLLGSLR